MSKLRIFISWSKNKSKLLAKATKEFLDIIFNGEIEFFFSPEMYKGTGVDNEIHKNLLECEKCIVCITSDNFKNPWLLYEAGVIYGANYKKNSKYGIVIPILFEHIPDWSSWVDKPLNRYVPIHMQGNTSDSSNSKNDFYVFVNQIRKECGIDYSDFEINWDSYYAQVERILKTEENIPEECSDFVNTLLKNENNCFTMSSPEITKEHIMFHKGFTTHALTKILTDSIKDEHSKYLWIYGRKNKKLLSREYDDFFEYLSTTGIEEGVDFRCMFPMPFSEATKNASSKDSSKTFDSDLQISLTKAINLKMKFDLPIEKMFRLYLQPRKESIIRIDNVILYKPIVRDSYGYPLPYTNTGFEVLSALPKEKNNKGYKLKDSFESLWSDKEKSVPLTEELFKKIYNK